MEVLTLKAFLRGIFGFFSFYERYPSLHNLRPSDSTVLEDAGIEARTVATLALTARRSNHAARSQPLLDIIHTRLDLIRVLKAAHDHERMFQ